MACAVGESLWGWWNRLLVDDGVLQEGTLQVLAEGRYLTGVVGGPQILCRLLFRQSLDGWGKVEQLIVIRG